MGLKYKIATLGSHSALQILKGAKDEGFGTLLISPAERRAFYQTFPFIDEVIEIRDFSEFPKSEKQLIEKRVIIVPHGSFVAYLGLEGNKRLKVPYFGNKDILDWEGDRGRQRLWLSKAGMKMPKQFKSAEAVDRPVLVKSHGAKGGYGYFLAKDRKELQRRCKDFPEKGYVIQEYIIGVPVFVHYFYSPLNDEIEIMSADRRYETNADGLGRVPHLFKEGWDLDPSYTVIGNFPITLRESLLPEVWEMGRRVVETSKKLIGGKGLLGPFCLETIITNEQKIYTIEISARIVAGTNPFISSSPYTNLRYKEPMSTGRRIAREIKLAIKEDRLKEVLS